MGSSRLASATDKCSRQIVDMAKTLSELRVR